MSINEIIGSELLGKSGNISSQETLQNRVVGIYFSAHWCGPCRQFTPILAEFYNNFKAMGAPMEIIFVSADQNQEEFNKYYSTMPWVALPFGNPNNDLLNDYFKIEGIPTLVFVDPLNNKVLTTEGRELLEGGENQLLDWCFN